MDKSFILAYHQVNTNRALELEQHLGAGGYSFEHYAQNGQNEDSLSERLLQDNRPVMLVISDNFLKSVSCMRDGLSLLQQLTNANRLFAVIVDGQQAQGQSVPTRFERVSDVIQYMNYWQNEYLELRKEKKEHQHEEESFKAHLRVVRSISSEIGEFLRQLRGEEYHHFGNLSEQQMRPFFDFTKDPAGQSQYLAALPITSPVQETEMNPSTFIPEVNEPTNVEEEVESAVDNLQEEVSEVPFEVVETPEEEPSVVEEAIDPIPSDPVPASTPEVSGEPIEEPPVPIMEIPGMDQLAEHEEAGTEFTENGEQAKASITEDSSSLLSQVVRYEKEKGQEIHPDLSADTFFHEEEMEDRGQMQEELEEPQEESNESTEAPISIWEEDFDDEPSTPLEKPDLEDPAMADLFDVDDQEEEEDSDEKTNLEPGDNQKAYLHPDQLLEHAQGLFANNMSDEGTKVLLDGTQMFAEDPTIRYEYALALIKYQEEHEDAAYQLREALLLDEEHLPSLFLLGELSEIDDELEDAEKLYERVLELDPDFEGVHKRLGMVLQKQQKGDPKRLAGLFKKAIKENKYDAESQYIYAVLMAEALDQPQKAAKYFKKTLKYKPDHPFASYDLALYYHREGRYEKAQKYYHRAVEINPELQTPQNDAAFIIPEIPEETTAAAAVQEQKETPQRPQLTDTVLITGATSGIGRASAFEFAQKGYQLVLTGRRPDRLEALKKELQAAYGIGITLLQFDVRDQEACQSAVDQLQDLDVQIDILVNNAGLAMGLDPIHEGDIFHWETMIDTNIKGLLYMTRLISPSMVARQKGHIINVCSTAGKEVYPNGNVYCATKHAVDALTRAMRLDLAKYNIRVSQVAPAMVEETEFAVVRFEGDEERAKIYEDFQPLKAKDVAETIAFIATRPAYVNIQDVVMLGTQQASSTQVHRTGR